MSNTEVLKNLIATSRRQLQLLDKETALLRKLVDADHVPDDSNYPYFYGAVGEDGNEGITVDAGIAGPVREVTGRVIVQSDAPFVWTHVAMAQRHINPTEIGDSATMGVWMGSGGTFLTTNPNNIDIGFVEEGSGRVLFQSDEIDPVSGANEIGKLVSGASYNTAGMYGLYGGGVLNEVAGGNGPNYVFPLPRQTMLPANDVVLVKLRPNNTDFNSNDPRVYVTLIGYKIFED
jgi:hypothetical protein